jgi:hypothetical protein
VAIKGLRRWDFLRVVDIYYQNGARLVCCLAFWSLAAVSLSRRGCSSGVCVCVCVWVGARCIHLGRDGRGRHFWPRHFLPPAAAAYTHTTIYIMNNSKHALTINQPDNNQLLKCYNIWGSKWLCNFCATSVQKHLCTLAKPVHHYRRTLRVQTIMICHFTAVASVHCTILHNFFRSFQIC